METQKIKEEILKIINDPKAQPLTSEEVRAHLSEDSENLDSILKEMVSSDEITMNKKKTRYMSLASVGIYKGVILIRNDNYGFIKAENFDFDFYVSKYDFYNAMDKDEVLFTIIKTSTASSNSEAKVVKILSRNLKYAVGEVKLKKDRYYLELETSDIKKKIYLNNIKNAKISDIVRCEITKYDIDFCEANVVDVIGSKSDIGMDISQIVISLGMSLKFPDNVLYAAKNLEDDTKEEYKRRRDLTNKIIFTIDGVDAKDLDDAVGIEKLASGNYKLGVYIADVSHFVTEGSDIDKEAYNRGTSVYLTDRVIPMLPVRLSNDLCSLNHGENKLVIGCEMEIDNQGRVITSDIFEAVISTTKRLNYTDCNKVLTEGIESVPEYTDVYDSLLMMRELSQILINKRVKRGALDFDIPEGEVVVDEKGIPIDVVVRPRGISEKIIEEFMILANETVAETINHMDLPFIYRVHDKPDNLKLEELKITAGYLGYSVRGNYVSELQKFLESIDEKDAFLKTFVLRLMAKAVYSEENIGHFGLASECYTHFTSPIRRYPDLIVHRLLRKYLFNGDINPDDFLTLTNKIADIAYKSSQNERRAIDCEFKVTDMKEAEYMSYHIGEKFEGTISSITSFGMFITLENTIEGLVRLKDIEDDYYIYNQINHCIVGQNTQKKYRIGDVVKVKVANADKKTSEIDFKIVYNKVSTRKRVKYVNPDRHTDFREKGKTSYGKQKHHRQK